MKRKRIFGVSCYLPIWARSLLRKRLQALGFSQSQYLRRLVEKDLAEHFPEAKLIVAAQERAEKAEG